MPKFFVNQEQIQKEEIDIISDDINHIKNVLRKKVGDELIICNTETKTDYICEIINISDELVKCKINSIEKNDVESSIKITIFQGIPKADKMELIIQKSVELGVFDITPVEMKRCVVKLNEKDKIKKNQRWQKISEVAAKQCGRGVIPKINDAISIKEVCNLCQEYDIVLVAYENEKNTTLKEELINIRKKYVKDNLQELKIAVLIGPEGGIDENEINLLKKSGANVITLGKRILRTETVALSVISIIMYELEN